MKKKKILVFGGNGFLGSWVTEMLKDKINYDTVIIKGKKDLDITDFNSLLSYLKKNSFDYIINCSAFVGGIAFGY